MFIRFPEFGGAADNLLIDWLRAEDDHPVLLSHVQRIREHGLVVG